jgi:hypothetical protein
MRETPEYNVYLVVAHCVNEECANPVIGWTIHPHRLDADIFTSGMSTTCPNCGKVNEFRPDRVAHMTELLLKSGKSYTLRTWDNTDQPKEGN